MSDLLKSDLIRWLLPVMLAAGALVSYARQVPGIQVKVQEHDVRLAVVDTKLSAIQADTTEIKHLLSRGRR